MSSLFAVLEREKHVREDGWLAEIISTKYEDTPFKGIHSYCVSIEPNSKRAGHYHLKKNEWFCVLSGKIKLDLLDIETNESKEVKLNSDGPTFKMINVKPKIAHLITNLSSENKANIVVFSEEPPKSGDTIEYSFNKK